MDRVLGPRRDRCGPGGAVLLKCPGGGSGPEGGWLVSAGGGSHGCRPFPCTLTPPAAVGSAAAGRADGSCRQAAACCSWRAAPRQPWALRGPGPAVSPPPHRPSGTLSTVSPPCWVQAPRGQGVQELGT